jgi:hypothetical protein
VSDAASHGQAPAGDKALVGIAGACTLLVGARFVEHLVYDSKGDAFGKGPIARVIDFFSTAIGQVWCVSVAKSFCQWALLKRDRPSYSL